MNLRKHFESLGLEVQAVKNRVRYLIEGNHWQTDGEWKESVLRSVLRRYLPASVLIGRGFVLASDQASHQLDILIYKAESPVLFRDGDLVILTPDAVLGIIEVKTQLNPSEYRNTAEKLSEDISFIRNHPNCFRVFAGVFSYRSSSGNSEDYLRKTQEVCMAYRKRITFASIGENVFLKYWHFQPNSEKAKMYQSWHAYNLPKMAIGYFISNVINSVCPDSLYTNSELWYPNSGKEEFFKYSLEGQWAMKEE